MTGDQNQMGGHPFVAYLTADVTLTLTRADAQFLTRDYLIPAKRSFDGSRETISGARQRIADGMACATDAGPDALVQIRLPRVVAEELTFALSQAFASSYADPDEPASSTLYCVLPGQLDEAHRIGGILDRQLYGDTISTTPLIRAAHEVVERDLAWESPPAPDTRAPDTDG